MSGETAEQRRESRGSTSKLPDSQLAKTALEFSQQADKLSLQHPEGQKSAAPVGALFVTPQDPVIVTSDGSRLPGVPLEEAHKLNILKEELHSGAGETVVIKEGGEVKDTVVRSGDADETDETDEARVVTLPTEQNGKSIQATGEGTLQRAMPPSHTNPLFPPLPLYGPPSFLRNVQCHLFRTSSFFLSLAFLAVIVMGAVFTSIVPLSRRMLCRLTLRDPDAGRPFYQEERRRRDDRRKRDKAWKSGKSPSASPDAENAEGEFLPTEGGPDPLVCDVGYYARRVGLDAEEYRVQTEDGFLIDLWHVYDPREYTEIAEEERRARGPELFTSPRKRWDGRGKKPKFPVLLLHGLLQSSGAYCCSDDESLAFFLCKSGYDVWLGNNRCGFNPKHVLLEYADPRMWCWNIRQMGVFDLPALVSRVRYETGFDKVGLICHSQGTTQTFVALAKEQRPDLGRHITVFCALAPAAYAGPLIGKMYFKFMRVISPSLFRIMFGIHSFIPFMMTMHSLLHPRLYGFLGYKVFSFLFDWTDQRWDRDLKDRMFQFAPVYVSAESMRWWLGRECFARHKCILSTKEAVRAEEREDELLQDGHPAAAAEKHGNRAAAEPSHRRKPRGATAWYDEQVPPFALWVCGNDALVDGEKLLRRFERGREPHVKVVHSKVIAEYEHLDVIWAMDAVDQVFKEVREVLWKTCNVRKQCRVPAGCDEVGAWAPPASMAEQLGQDGIESQSSSSED